MVLLRGCVVPLNEWGKETIREHLYFKSREGLSLDAQFKSCSCEFIVAFLPSMTRRLFSVLTFQTRFEDRSSYFCTGFDFSEKAPSHDD